MTLTFDPLTLKVFGRSDVMWSLSVANFSEIEQTSAELFIIWQIGLFDLAQAEVPQKFKVKGSKV